MNSFSPMDADSQMRLTYQPSLFHHRSIKKFTVKYQDRIELFDTFAEAHGRAQRLKRMGVKAVVGAKTVNG